MSAEALSTVFDETILLFHRLRAAAEEVHGQGPLSGGRRGVLRSLYRLGPQTVPQMARARPVSRQHIQMLVNGLLEDGLVELAENPAHKRSHLVGLTGKGRALIEKMLAREAAVLAAVKIEIPERDLRRTAEVLRSLREFLGGTSWKRSLRRV